MRALKAANGQTAGRKSAPTFFIAVIGDSQASMLAQGLAEAFAGDHRVAIVNKAKEDTGLVRNDFYDWRAAARSLLDGPQHFDAAVVQIGINDNQKLRLGGEPSPDPLSKPFNEIYAKRAEELAAIFREKKVPLIWVGQPIMRSESLSNAALVFNDIDRQYAEAQGAHYVDLWEAFSDENSVYRASGPDVNGVIVRLRAADGVHFNKAGARKAAHFVEPEIRKLLEAALQPPETPAGATPEAPATPAPPAGRAMKPRRPPRPRPRRQSRRRRSPSPVRSKASPNQRSLPAARSRRRPPAAPSPRRWRPRPRSPAAPTISPGPRNRLAPK